MILVIDLEATCSDDGSISAEQMEIIELGAVWATYDGNVVETMQSFVRPTKYPQLTPFCTELTSIQQAHVDTAPNWPEVAAELARFGQRYPAQYWGSWGRYDARQIERECASHKLTNPLSRLAHLNLKAGFAKGRKIKQVGMTTALRIAGLALEGQHHRALCDASNIARLLPFSYRFC